MTCEHFITAYLAVLKDGFACRTDPHGRLQVVTPFLYPDHDNVEVFVWEKADGSLVVSDLGETLGRLDTLGMNVCSTPKLMFLAERIAGGFGVRIADGVIRKDGRLEDAGQIAFAVISVCQGVGDMIYRHRGYTPSSFDDEVARFLEDGGVSAEPKPEVQGRSGTGYYPSFAVQTREGVSLLEAISPKSNAGVRAKVNAVHRMWSDVHGFYNRAGAKVSLLNDEELEFKDHDVRLLDNVSRVFRWSERQGFLAVIQGESAGRPDPPVMIPPVHRSERVRNDHLGRLWGVRTERRSLCREHAGT